MIHNSNTNLNQLETVTIDWLSSKPVATYYYDDAGRLDYVVNFNGTITDYGYDNANRLTDLVNKTSSNFILADYHYTLDGNGNRTQTVQNEPFAPTPLSQDVSYTYNSKQNRLVEAGEYLFLYDNEGQLSSDYRDSSNWYTFDYEHRLTAISGRQSAFSYDGAGNRVQAVRNGVTTRYIYDAGGNLLAEADGSNNITKYYIYGAGLLAMVTPTNQVYTYHFNAVGSTIAMTDSTQSIVNKYSYDAFGNITNQVENANVIQPFKFVGQYGVMTEPNGFYYMRARYYDPSVGRFISEDPIGFDGGDVNLMAYVGNNPILMFDPRGLWSLSLDAYAVVGGGITVGGDENQPFFISFRYGMGEGGGVSYDPDGSSPSSNPNSISDIGFASHAGVSFLPLELGAGFNTGISHLPNGEVKGYASDVDVRPIVSTGSLKLEADAYFAVEGTLYPKNIWNALTGICHQ